MRSIRKLAEYKTTPTETFVDIELPLLKGSFLIDKASVLFVFKISHQNKDYFFTVINDTIRLIHYSIILEKWFLKSNIQILVNKTESSDFVKQFFIKLNIELFNKKISRVSNIPLNIETV